MGHEPRAERHGSGFLYVKIKPLYSEVKELPKHPLDKSKTYVIYVDSPRIKIGNRLIKLCEEYEIINNSVNLII